MIRLIIILAISFSLASCADKNGLPPGVLPQEKMQAITWDLLRAGEFLNGYVLYKDTSIDQGTISKKWYDRVYDLHKVTREEYDASYAYYREHPLIMKRLLDSLARKEVIVVSDSTKYGQAVTDSVKKRLLLTPPKTLLPDTFNRRKRTLKKTITKEVQ